MSTENYCYKIHALMECCVYYHPFYRHPPSFMDYSLPQILQENLEPPSKQIKFWNMQVHMLRFYIFCSLTYFCIKIFAHVEQILYYLYSSWMQTILTVKSIKWLCHYCNCKSFCLWKTEDAKSIFRTQSNI